MKPLMPVVALISGRGSNLKSLLDAQQRGEIPGRFAAVISNRPDAAGLDYARATGIPAEVVDHKTYADREAFERELCAHIEVYQPGLVVLAGFMRVLGTAFVERFAGRMINIHPSLLPEFPGLHTHERALASGATRHGASVHFVTPGVDQGPVILQGSVQVEGAETPDSLAKRVLTQVEHRIYPLAVRWFCEKRLTLECGSVRLDGNPLIQPLQLEALAARESAA